MDILIAILTAFLIEIVKHITKDFWKWIKKRINKKATFTPNNVEKGGKSH